MGGDVRDFYSSSMFDFQSLRDAYMLSNGIDDTPDADEDPETTEDLDSFYSQLAKHIKKE